MSIVARAYALIVSPRAEWPRIAGEPATIGGLFAGYAMVLAAIPAVAGFIGTVVVGFDLHGETVHMPARTGLLRAVAQYVSGLAGLWILGQVIAWLAPAFRGERDGVAAMKLAVYSATPYWLAGIFGAVPALGLFGLLGFYSLYLVHTGLPALLRCPPEKALPCTIAVILCGFAVLGGAAVLSTLALLWLYDIWRSLSG